MARFVNWLAEAPELLCKRSDCCWPDKKVISGLCLGKSVHGARSLVAAAKFCCGRVCFCSDSMRSRSLATCSHRIGSALRLPTFPRVEASDQIATPRVVLQRDWHLLFSAVEQTLSICATLRTPDVFLMGSAAVTSLPAATASTSLCLTGMALTSLRSCGAPSEVMSGCFCQVLVGTRCVARNVPSLEPCCACCSFRDVPLLSRHQSWGSPYVGSTNVKRLRVRRSICCLYVISQLPQEHVSSPCNRPIDQVRVRACKMVAKRVNISPCRR